MSNTIAYEQPTSAPVPKVAAVGYAGAATALVPIIVMILASFNIIVPDELSNQAIAGISAVVSIFAVIQAIVQFAAGYLKKDEKPIAVVNSIKRSGVN